MECRIAHLTSVHGPLDSRIFYREARSLARAGYDVVVVAPTDADRTEDGVRIRAVARPKNRFARVFATGPAVFRAALKERCAVYHLHDPELLPWGLLLRAMGKRVIYDAHEDLPNDIALKRWIPRALRGLASRVALVASRLLSRGLSATIVAVPQIGAGVRSRRIVTLYNYPVLEDISRIDVRAWQDRGRAAIYHGTISADRGLWEMLAAMESPQTPADARLTLAGRFDDPELLAAAQRRPGWRHIDYVGWMEGSALWKIVADAKIGVVTLHPTQTFLDSIPTKLLEYMALGLPVVASDFPIWRAIVEPAGCGVLVDPLDPSAIGRAIAALLRDPVRAAQMGARGREAALARYQWEAEAKKLLALYADLCAAG